MRGGEEWSLVILAYETGEFEGIRVEHAFQQVCGCLLRLKLRSFTKFYAFVSHIGQIGHQQCEPFRRGLICGWRNPIEVAKTRRNQPPPLQGGAPKRPNFHAQRNNPAQYQRDEHLRHD